MLSPPRQAGAWGTFWACPESTALAPSRQPASVPSQNRTLPPGVALTRPPLPGSARRRHERRPLRPAATTSVPPVSAGGCAMATARYTSMMVVPGKAGFPHERLALPLLRRHVARRPDDSAGRREGHIGLELLHQRARQPEVEQLDTVRSEKNVRGLEVPVSDPARVECLQRGEDAEGDQRAGDGQGGIRTLDTVARMPPFQGGAFNRSATCPDSLRGRNLAVQQGPVNAVWKERG